MPIRNGGERWRQAAAALRDAVPDSSLIAAVDSGSTDGSVSVAADNGFEVVRIDPRSFNHGRTRQEAVDRFCRGKEIAVFLTHDAVIEGPASLNTLLDAFSDPLVGAAYGRQLPHAGAGAFGRHSATFLYPALSHVRKLSDAPVHGIRTAHISNSFAAYRIRALQESGGFPGSLILGEDAYAAFRMLQAGWSVRYCADALVRHSHDYSILEELQRYFDYGVMHAQVPDLLRALGTPEGDGLRFVLSELRFVSSVAPWRLPEVLVRNSGKFLGYRLGLIFKRLPDPVRRRLSMTKGFWDSPPTSGAQP